MSYKNFHRYKKKKANGGPTDPPFKTPTYEDSLYLYQRSLPQKFYATFPEGIQGDTKHNHYGLMSREQAEQLTNISNPVVGSRKGGRGLTWSPFAEDKVSYDAPEIIQKYNPAPENDEFANDEWRSGINWELPYFETVEKAPIKPIGYDVVGWTQWLEGDTHNRRRRNYINGTLADSSSREWQDEGRWGTEDEYGSWRVQARYPKPTGKPTPEKSASSLAREVKRDELTQEMKDAGFTGYSAREVLKPGSDAAKAWEKVKKLTDVDYKRYGKDKKSITDIPESGQIFVTSKDDPLYKEYAQRRKLYKESEKGWNLERDKWYDKEVTMWDDFIEATEGNVKDIKDSKAEFDSEEDYQKLLKEHEDIVIETKRKKEEALKRVKEEDYLSEMKSTRLDFKTELNELENYGGGYVNEIIDYSTGTEINENKLDYLKDLNKSKYRPVLMYGPAESGYTVGWDKPKLRVTYRDPSEFSTKASKPEFTKTQLNEFIKSDDKQDLGKVKNLLNISENDVSDNYNPKIDGPFPSRTKKEPKYPTKAPEGYSLVKGWTGGDGISYGDYYTYTAGPKDLDKYPDKPAGPPKKQYGGPIGSISTETWPLIDKVTKNLAKAEENKQFLISMANSPLFGERYKRMSGNPDLTDEEIDSYRQDIINNLNTARPIHQNLETLEQRGAAGYYRPRTKEAVIATSPKDSTQEFLKKKEELYNRWFPNQSHSINLPFADDFSPSAHTHELSHASTIGDLDLRAKDEPIARFARGEDAHIGNYAEGTFLETPYKKLFPNLEEKREGYLTDKSEQKARKDALAKHLRDRGIYDPVNETFNENHYNALVQDYFKLGMKKDREAAKKAFDEDPHIYFQMGDILRNYNKENVINMFNDFVQNENQEQGLPMAAYGGPTAKYYHGGFPHDPPIYDFTKTVEENAERGVDTSGKSVAVKTSLPQYNTATEVGDFANKMSRAKWEIEKDHINVPGKRGYEDGRYVHKDEMTAQDRANVNFQKNKENYGVTGAKVGQIPSILMGAVRKTHDGMKYIGGEWMNDVGDAMFEGQDWWNSVKNSGVQPWNSHLDQFVDKAFPKQIYADQIKSGGIDQGFYAPGQSEDLISMGIPIGGGSGGVLKQGFKSLGDDIYRGVPKSLKTTHTNIGQNLVSTDLPKSRLVRKLTGDLKDFPSITNLVRDKSGFVALKQNPSDKSYFFSAYMNNPRNAGKSIIALDEKIPSNSLIKNKLGSTYSDDSYSMVLNRAKRSNYTPEYDIAKGEKLWLNPYSGKSMKEIYKLKTSGESIKVDGNTVKTFSTKEVAQKYVDGINKKLDKADFNIKKVNAEVKSIPGTQEYGIKVPNIGLRKGVKKAKTQTDELPFGFNKEQYLQDKAAKEANITKHGKDAYISSVETPKTRKDDIFESFYGNERFKQAKEDRTTYFDKEGNIIPKEGTDYKKEIKNIQKNKGSMDYYYGGPVIWATGNRDERISHQKQLPPQNQKTISSTFGLTGTPYDVNYYNTDLSKPIDYNAAKPMPYTGNRDLRLRALKRGMGGTVNENQMDTMNQYEQGKNTVVGAMGAIPGWGQAVQGFSALGKAGDRLTEQAGIDTNIFDPFGNIVENLSSDKTSQQKAGNIVKNLVTGGLSGDDNLFGFFAYGGQPDYMASGGELDLSPKGGNSQYEAEGGEIVIGGMPEVYNGGNLKQNSENAFKIEGNSHENGGVDMSGGDYIFSDRIYLDDDILNELDL